MITLLFLLYDWVQGKRHILKTGQKRPPSDIFDAMLKDLEDEIAEENLVRNLSMSLKGEPSEDFEAFTACPECKVMDYHKLQAVYTDREKCMSDLKAWKHFPYIDTDVLEAVEHLPDEMFFDWLRNLRVDVWFPNPKAGDSKVILGWGGFNSHRFEPDFVSERHKFPFAARQWLGYEVVRTCACGHKWGQFAGSVQNPPLGRLPQTAFNKPLANYSGGSSAARMGTDESLPWINPYNRVRVNPRTGELYL